jgi:predicted dehydrogenase
MPSTDKNDIRVALIGFGLGGASFHAPLIAATPGLRLATVVTGNAERAAQALRDYPGAQVVGDPDQLWRNAADHDLVVISTPNRSHVPLALAALDVGLPVVIDKPFAPTVAEARQVIAAAQEKKLAVSAYHIRRWDSECRTLRGLLEREEMGRVLRFESRLERWRPEPKAGWKESADPLDAGGMLYDIGSHLIDQALYLFGPVGEVYAQIDVRRAGAATDDDVFVAMTHQNGVHSHLWTSCLAAQTGARMRVMGDRASFVKQHGDVQEAALRAGARAGQAGWGEDPPAQWGVLSNGATQRAIPSVPGAYQDFYAGMVRALRGGAPLPVDPLDAVAGLAIIEAAQRSSAQRQVITLT